jgi:hypothetical protein
MGADNEERTAGGGRGAAWTWLFWFGVVAAAYVLSIGPVALLDDKAGWSKRSPAVDKGFELFYAPLIRAGQNTPLGKPLDWYIGLWVKD